jgi:hypothetical protein
MTENKTRTRRQEIMYKYPETQSTRAPINGIEPEWFSNEVESLYIVYSSSRMITTWHACKHATWRSCVARKSTIMRVGLQLSDYYVSIT